jgi:Rrf2 family protein
MKLSLSVNYAILALLQLRDDASEKPLSTSAMCKRAPMPERFLLQLMRKLTQHDLVTSSRGCSGGYCLKRPLEKISLFDVLIAIDGVQEAFPDVPCLDCLGAKQREVLTKLDSQLNADAKRRLSKVSLAAFRLAPA